MTDRVALTFFEIDLKYCDLVYGEAPCTAAIGVTGDHKCFNTRNFSHDCQDIANYDEGVLTLRFGVEGQPFVASMPCLPYIQGEINVKNAEIHPGEDIGIRAEFSLSLRDALHSDAGIDKYIADRDYNPFEQGTFWGKFRARNPYHENIPCRVLRGYVGDETYDTEHFVLSKMDGPDSDGRVSMSGRDFMYLLSDKSAQAPAVSEGYLSVGIDETQTNITLEPAGIGDDYPASGKWSIGDEMMSFVKDSGDDFTVVRGIHGTEAQEHDADEVAQIVLEYDSETVSHIIHDLVTNYSPLDASYIDLAAWDAIVAEFSDTLYSARIVKPTAVETLINELVEQAGLVLYGNTRTQQIVFDVLRPDAVTGVTYDERRFRAGSFKQTDQPRKRFSQVWVFYNQRDIYKNLDEPSNFYSAYVRTPGFNLYATESIKKIFSRWIPVGARSVANDVSSRAISRYVNPPRLFGFEVFAGENPQLGQASKISHPMLQDAFGARETADCIITGIKTKSEGFGIRAEELKFDASLVDLNRTFTIEFDTLNLNLRDLYDDTYATVDEVNPITFIVLEGVVVGSTYYTLPAIDFGDWPDGVLPNLIVRGFVVGRGGDGGAGASSGGPGGLALRASVPVNVDNQGIIGGGGGGGGGGVVIGGGGVPIDTVTGGGGAGRNPGIGFSNGTVTEGASVINGAGFGGDLGEPGTDGSGGPIVHYPGGLPGTAVDGDSLINWINEGDIRGARIG